MKKVILIIALLAAGTAQAEHHRQHALEKLDTAEKYLRQSLEQADVVANCAEFTDFQQKRANNFHTYLDRAFEDIFEARAILENGGDLAVARRLMSQPHKKAAKDGGEPSASHWAASQTRNIRLIFEEAPCPWNFGVLSIMQQKMTLGWQFLEFAEWHIVDAILEEK